MKRLNDYKTRLVLLGFVAPILLGSLGAKADFTFGRAENLGPTINSPSTDEGASITGDGLELYFSSDRPEGGGIWVAKRSTKDEEWGEPVHLGPTVNAGGAGSPSVTGDGLELYFVSARSGGYGQNDIWVTKRESKGSSWGEPENLGSPPNTDKNLWGLGVSFDGLEVYFSSGTAPGGYGSSGGHDIWVTRRAYRGAPWSEPEEIGPTINGPATDWENGQALSSDGLTIIFSSSRLGGCSTMTSWNLDLWMARRQMKDSPWGDAINLGPSINTPCSDMASSLSSDGRMLYFRQRSYEGVRPGGQGGIDIWQAPIIPIVDFNTDGIVDLKDFSRLAQYWGQNESSVDIAPPIGNGTVDVHDVAVLAENWLTEPGLVAHWELDETEGFVAHDSAGDHDGFVLSANPLWRPQDGKLNGALQLDGIDDCVSAPFVLNPALGPFSVFLWVKGEIPGQMILSQAGGANWLYTLGPMGWLMTNLGGTLLSQTVITDGQWHRIGFAWDGTKTILYVDDVNVAEGTQAGLASSQGGLYFGAGKDKESGNFFSGLIDDVRISVPTGQPPVTQVRQESTGFQIYADDNALDVFDKSWWGQGVLDHRWGTNPAEGAYCIYWTGVARYNGIGFDFWPDRDLTLLVQQGYALEFWVCGDSPGATFDVRFLDTKTDDPADHPWRMRKTIDESIAAWDHQWHRVRIPLTDFTEHGSWEDGSWYDPRGDYDWAAVDRFEIVAEHSDLTGVQLWFDDIRIAE